MIRALDPRSEPGSAASQHSTGGAPRAARKQARRAAIIAAAWEIATDEGLAAVTLHEVARRVGLRQPSLYAYISAKSDLYDAMFAQAYALLIEQVAAVPRTDDARRDLLVVSRTILDFSVSDVARQQLLFQRTIPGFTPSQSSYALAEEFLDEAVELLRRAGVTEPADIDVYTAIIAGLTAQQIANDPDGDRWTRHLDQLVARFLGHVTTRGPVT